MGTYTELVIKTRIATEDHKVRTVLNYLFNEAEDAEPPTDLPDHPFFVNRRWDLIGKCSSYYHIPTNLNYFKDGYLFSRSDLKNYDNTIEEFIDWISPYTTGIVGSVLGWICIEQHNPVFIIKRGIEEGVDDTWKSDFEVIAEENLMKIYGRLTIEELENVLEYYKTKGFKYALPGHENSSILIRK